MSDTQDPAQAGGDTQTAPAAAGGADSQPDGAKFDRWAELRTTTKELNKAQKRIAELENAEQTRKDAELSDLERSKKRESELESQLEQERTGRRRDKLESALRFEALQAGCRDVDTFLKVALNEPDKFEFDQNGNVQGVGDYVKASKAKLGYFFGQTPPAPGPSGGNPSSGAPKNMTVQKLESMNHEQRTAYFGF